MINRLTNKKIMRIYYKLFILSFVLLCSCQKDEVLQPELTAGFVQILPTDTLSISFSIDSREHNLFSRIKSINSTNAFEISVVIDSLKPINPISSISPSAIHFPLIIKETGIKPLTIWINNKKRFEGNIHITDNYVEIEKKDSKNFTFNNQKIMRIPENLVWGYFSYKQEKNNALNMEVEDLFSKLGCTKLTLPQGSYSYYFDIADDGLIENDHYNPNNYYIQDFVYQYNETYEIINTAIENFVATQKQISPENPIGITLQNSKNERINF